MSKKYIKLQVITEPKPNTRSVIAYEGKGTVAVKAGKGKYNFTCGSCGAVLIEGATEVKQISDIVIKCNRCQSFNDARLFELPNHLSN